MSDEKVVTNQGEETQEQKESKVQKKFEETLAKLTALIKGAPSKNGRLKVPKDDVNGLISELFKEEHEALREEVKVELKALLKQYVTLNQEIEKKKKELAKIELDQKKAFAEAGEKLFNKIEGLPQIQAEYVKGLSALNNPTT